MMPWFMRYSAQMTGLQLLMLLLEFASFIFAREQGVNRFYWLPLSLVVVAVAGYITVRRMPLMWGGVAGAVLYAITSVLSWPIGEYVIEGKLGYPQEAEPVLVLTTMLLMAIVGAIFGVAAGAVARSRRRQRVRRAAMNKLAFGSFVAPGEGEDQLPPSMSVR